MAGYVREVFPGGNTPQGFYSFYDYIVSPSARRIFIIKGGPGVGKSTFMKTIANRLLDMGIDLEFHHCSSDNNSLDGIYVPSIDIAMIDGTAPHIVDPKNPGAVDEIIHLGDYWDEKGMEANKQPILDTNKEVGRLFRRSYNYLASAKNCMDQVESCYLESEALDIASLNMAACNLISNIFSNVNPVPKAPRARHLFASAISPQGPKHYLSTLIDRINTVIHITGDWGTGRTTLIKKIADFALNLGYNVEVYHCPMDPVKYDHIIIPDLSVALINNSAPHSIPSNQSDIIISTNEFLNDTKLTRVASEISTAKELYARLFAEAVALISKAKTLHDQMETYYIPNMDFNRISEVREKTFNRILDMAPVAIK